MRARVMQTPPDSRLCRFRDPHGLQREAGGHPGSGPHKCPSFRSGSNRFGVTLAVLCLAGLLAASAAGAEETSGDSVRLQGDVEASAELLWPNIVHRRVVRTSDGSLNVWLRSDADFERAVQSLQKAQAGKKLLKGGLRIVRSALLDGDKSYLLDLAGGDRPWRLRLSRHLTGTQIEVQDLGEASDAPRWTPPLRPVPILLPHGMLPR